MADLGDTWLLLIYTVPAEPSRLRAAVWREIKKAGAVYLRDGVCVLPERPSRSQCFQEIEARIKELGGQATLVRSGHLDEEKAQAIMRDARNARLTEYQDIASEIERFKAHLRREREHRDFTFGELQELEADLGKVQRWFTQVRDRDFVELDAANQIATALSLCETELASFAEEAYAQEDGMR